MLGVKAPSFLFAIARKAPQATDGIAGLYVVKCTVLHLCYKSDKDGLELHFEEIKRPTRGRMKPVKSTFTRIRRMIV